MRGAPERSRLPAPPSRERLQLLDTSADPSVPLQRAVAARAASATALRTSQEPRQQTLEPCPAAESFAGFLPVESRWTCVTQYHAGAGQLQMPFSRCCA